MAIIVTLIIRLSGFFFDGLSVGFDGWLNASEAVNCLTDLVESLMTHWLTDNWLSDYLSDSVTFRVIDLITGCPEN